MKLELVSHFLKPLIRPRVVPANYMDRVKEIAAANPSLTEQEIAHLVADEIVAGDKSEPAWTPVEASGPGLDFVPGNSVAVMGGGGGPQEPY